MFRWLAVVVVILFSVVVVLPESQAGGCRTVVQTQYQSYTPTYYPPVYQIEQAVIAVPTIFFQWLTPAVAQVSQAAPAAPAQVAAPAKTETEAERIDRLVREKLEAVIREQVGGGDDLPMIVDHDVTASAAPVAVLASRCASCHTAPAVKGGVILFRNGVFQPNVPVSQVVDAASSKRMPPSARTQPATAVPAGEVAVLRSLINQR